MGKFFKIAEENMPYTPKPVELPASPKIPNIRPNPIKNSKPLTTSSKSSLGFKPKNIKLAKRDLYQYYKDKNWDPTKESWWDEDKGLTYGWSNGKWGDPVVNQTPTAPNNTPPPPATNNTPQGDISDKINSGNYDLKNLYKDDWYKGKTDSIRVLHGHKPRKWVTQPVDTLGTAQKQKILNNFLGGSD